MTFAKRVFMAAGIWGLLVVPPLFFLYDTVGRQNPPAITHPEYYYGFAAITTAWQLAFLVIASDPIRPLQVRNPFRRGHVRRRFARHLYQRRRE